MATQSPGDGFGPSPEEQAEVARLEAEIEDCVAQLATARAEAKQFQKAEDPEKGVFHAQDIFERKQDAMRLEVEIQMRRVKINRILLGPDAPGLFQ